MKNRNHFEEACAALGIDTTLPDVSMIAEEFARPIIALYKLQVIVKAWNGKWVADWNDQSQYKWGCWWWMNAPGFRFVDAFCDFASTLSTGGSRLCFASEKLAEKAGAELDYLFADLMGGILPAKTSTL